MRNGFLIFILLLTPQVFAHPVAYQGATGVMTWNQPFMTDKRRGSDRSLERHRDLRAF